MNELVSKEIERIERLLDSTEACRIGIRDMLNYHQCCAFNRITHKLCKCECHEG